MTATAPSTFAAVLRAELTRRCARNPSYSLRAFARALDTDHATLSQLLRGRRALTRETIEQLGERLGLPRASIDAHVRDALAAREGPPAPSAVLDAATIDQANALGYRQVSTGPGGIDGGIWPAPPEGEPMVQLYIESAELEGAVGRARGLGAQVVVPPQSLPDGDALAILVDPEGRPFGVHRPAQTGGAR